MRRVAIAVFTLAAVACGGGGDRGTGAEVPNPIAPGKISVRWTYRPAVMTRPTGRRLSTLPSPKRRS